MATATYDADRELARKIRDGFIKPAVVPSYNPQTGIQTFADGTTAHKFTWEPDTNNPSQLYATNTGAGVRLPGEPIANPQQTAPVTIAAPAAADTSMLDYIQILKDAQSSNSEPFYHPDLVKDDSDEDEEIL